MATRQVRQVFMQKEMGALHVMERIVFWGLVSDEYSATTDFGVRFSLARCRVDVRNR
mgnify:FL=1